MKILFDVPFDYIKPMEEKRQGLGLRSRNELIRRAVEKLCDIKPIEKPTHVRPDSLLPRPADRYCVCGHHNTQHHRAGKMCMGNRTVGSVGPACPCTTFVLRGAA